MKPSTLKLSAILIVFLFTGLGCQEDEEWETIELNSTICNGLTRVDYTFTDYTGVIDTLSGNYSTYVIKGVEPEFVEDVIFWPCNLPSEYYQVGLEISFSGDVLKTSDWKPGNPQPDYVGTPVVITDAKVKVTGK